MPSPIDDALADMISLYPEDLDAMRPEGMTMAQQAARKIIEDAISEGGASMKLLVERLGGTAAGKNSSTSVSGEAIAEKLAKALGGDGEDD